MAIVGTIVAVGVVALIAWTLIPHLGWPSNGTAIARWVKVLVVACVLFLALPEIFGAIGDVGLPSSDGGGLILLGVFVGLAVVGYAHWHWRAAQRSSPDDRTRLVPRRRATPPAPRGHPPTTMEDDQ
jgi:hypothetical protein